MDICFWNVHILCYRQKCQKINLSDRSHIIQISIGLTKISHFRRNSVLPFSFDIFSLLINDASKQTDSIVFAINWNNFHFPLTEKKSLNCCVVVAGIKEIICLSKVTHTRNHFSFVCPQGHSHKDRQRMAAV